MIKLSVTEKDLREVTGLQGYNLFSHQRRRKSIIELIGKTLPAGSSILDVGCASGDISVELSLLGYNVHGIDGEPNRLSQAKSLSNKYGRRIVFENKSFEELDARERYDGILFGEVLEHFENPAGVLTDIKGLLNSGGKVFITTPNMPSLRNRLKFGLLGIFPDNNPEHKYYFDFKRFQRVVKETGYEICYFHTRYTNIFFKSRWNAYLESFLLSWFSFISKRSGDTIFAIISPKS